LGLGDTPRTPAGGGVPCTPYGGWGGGLREMVGRAGERWKGEVARRV
jgi:hypothetical protein